MGPELTEIYSELTDSNTGNGEPGPHLLRVWSEMVSKSGSGIGNGSQLVMGPKVSVSLWPGRPQKVPSCLQWLLKVPQVEGRTDPDPCLELT